MTREKIKVEKRDVLGKKVKTLRNEGIIPANIYGKDFVSVSIQLPTKEFIEIHKKAGETGVVDLILDGKTIPTLIHNYQLDPVNKTLFHVDFYKVNLKEKITAHVSVVATGEAPAVVDKKGVLLQTLDQVEVEALPTELPEKIEVSVENLNEVDDHITVEDLKTSEGTTILTDPTQTIFRISELVSKEAEEQASEEEALAEQAAEEGQAEAPAEGEETQTSEEGQPEAPAE